MIEYITYPHIDKVKYDRCISGSKGRRVYAMSWYLDCVTEGWDVLVEDDYSSVMPLPRNIKFGIPYLYTPAWVQQLGVFSDKDLSQDKLFEFVGRIPKKYLWMDYQFNSSNRFELSGLRIKKNYLLSLDMTYEQIRKGYNKNRTRILKMDHSGLKLDKRGQWDVFFEQYLAQPKPYPLTEAMRSGLKSLCETRKDQIQLWNVFSDGIFTGGLIWLQDEFRITYLVPLTTELGKQLHVSSFLVDQLIREFQGKRIVLDFEGSMVRGVEKFYKSFGAKAETYALMKKRLFVNV